MAEDGRSADDGESENRDCGADTDGGTDIVYDTIAPIESTAEYDLLELVADLEGVEIDELPSLYTQVGHFVETLFENPPSPESQMEITFSFAGYRITVMQNGDVKLVPVKETLEE
jgi:hypothetical protein